MKSFERDDAKRRLRSVAAELSASVCRLTPRGDCRRLGKLGEREVELKMWESGLTLSRHWCVSVIIMRGKDRLQIDIYNVDSDLDRWLSFTINGKEKRIYDTFWDNDLLANLLLAKLEELREMLLGVEAADRDRPPPAPKPPDPRSIEEILQTI